MNKKVLFISMFIIFILVLNFCKINSETDHNILAYFWAGRNYEEKGEIEKAKELYKKVENSNFLIVDVYYYLAQIYIKEENFEEAINSLLKLEKIRNYKELAVTSLVSNIDMDSEIKRIKEEKKKKEEEQKKNIEKLNREFLLQKPFPCNVLVYKNNRVKLLRGEIDNLNLKIGERLILIKDNKAIGEVELVEVKKFFSIGEIILISDKIKKIEGNLIADKIKIKKEEKL